MLIIPTLKNVTYTDKPSLSNVTYDDKGDA